MRLILIFIFFLNFNFSQNIDELVYFKSLPTEKTYFFKLEKVLLLDSYEYGSFYKNDPVDLTKGQLPEYVNSQHIEFNVYDERKSIQTIPQNNFEHVIIQKNSSDYLSSKIGSLEFLDNNRAIYNNTSLVFKVSKEINKNSFGNEIYRLRLSSSTKTIELPIYRISGSYKLVLNYEHLKSLRIEIIEEKIIPLKTIFNNRIIKEGLSISSISYELRRNSNYFESYTIVPSIYNIIRTDVFNHSYISKAIPKDDILFIFDLIEGI
tara:strand:+ start:1144 stop:1935 length:792 start_codon:yes stop_codon:yes gene_type:complete